LTARTRDGRRFEGTQSLIVTPGRCSIRALGRGQRRFYGLLTQLYTVTSKRNWGIGDLGDLKKLVGWSSRIGAAFVGLNPLHALANRDGEISPYSPVSRLYRNVAYIDVMAVPERTWMPAATRRIRSPALQCELGALRENRHVDYERVMDCKRPVLEILHRGFAARHRGQPTPRGRAYRRYLATEGQALTDFATFLTIQSHIGLRRKRDRDWRSWPAGYRDPRSARVREFASRHAEEINFHRYLQFELDRQLGAACSKARSAGLAVGLYQDLAIGSSSAGSDTWAFPGLFARGVTLGAPPDPFHSRGQDWQLPPLDPRRLAADGYRYWIRLVRGAFAHAGALRIDHVMGLFRQFWIPAGRPPTEGAYVRFPASDLLGILALESARAGALVIGEDLGTVPRGLPGELARWGILCTRVLYFARDRRGSFWPARTYPRKALVSANTHDMAPLAGYWSGHDLDLRRRSGQLRSTKALLAARSQRVRERRLIVRRLVAEGVLPKGGEPSSGAELCDAINAFLCRTPAALVGIALDDLAGEIEPINMPGVGAERFKSWSRRLHLPLEALSTDPAVSQALRGAAKSGRARRRKARVSRGGSAKPHAALPRPRRARAIRD
jgi:4-alpha-glucanotransferase